MSLLRDKGDSSYPVSWTQLSLSLQRFVLVTRSVEFYCAAGLVRLDCGASCAFPWSLITLPHPALFYLPFPDFLSASLARSRGLQPLADQLLAQGLIDPAQLAASFISPEVPTAKLALEGACQIVAETISEHAQLRASCRELIGRTIVSSKAKAREESAKSHPKPHTPKPETYSHYFHFSQPANQIKPYQTLALRRGEQQEALTLTYSHNKEAYRTVVHKFFPVQQDSPCAHFLETAIQDAISRLVLPSLERELKKEQWEAAGFLVLSVLVDLLQ